ncbi:MAG: AraC family transcriptional regulator [Flavobacteriaceae bacterium]
MLVKKELKIKGMVCPRCLSTVRDQLQNLGATVLNLKLGTVIIEFQENSISDDLIKRTLKLSGFELLTDDESKIIENIKLVLRQIVDDTPIVLKENLSRRLVLNFDKDYTFLSKLFSRVEEVTIEKYFIQLKIEKAKELIQYDQLNFTEIAYELGYSSVNYLSNQFKTATGMNMRDYKKASDWDRKPLNKIL